MSGRYKGKLFLSFVMSFLESSMAAIGLFMVYLSFDWIQNGRMTYQKVGAIALVMVLSLIFRYLFKLLDYIYQSGVGYEVVCDERLKLGQKLLRLPMGFYQDIDAGNISSVINTDLVFVEGMAMSFVSKMIGGFLSAGLMMLFLYFVDLRVALTACLVYPVALAANKKIQQRWIKYSVRRQESHAETAATMLEYLQGIYVIKAFGIAGRQGKRFKEVLDRLEVNSYNYEMKALPYMILYLLSFHFGTVLIPGCATYLLIAELIAFSAGMLVVVMLFTIYAPMEMIAVSSGFIRLMNTCLDRVQTIMDAPVMDEGTDLKRPEGSAVEFQDVSFSYGSRSVLNNISFSAPERSMTAIVGPSGSGKSTMLNLIARFWDISEGRILIGGADIRSMKCETVMEQITAVFQKAYLFQDTIYQNILLGHPGADREQVIEAAEKARCHEFIMKLEKGYETVVGEGGATLSGGERQRISIARAFLKDAPVILLDEVTANIDPRNEQLIQQAVSDLVRDKTVFIVAHKLSTIQDAHQIIVLDENGRIAEAGRHDELYQQQGAYRQMWEKSRRISQWSL